MYVECEIYKTASLYMKLTVFPCLFSATDFKIVYSGGALKPTDVDTLWVHITCAWFCPGVGFLDHDKMEPAVGILRILPSTFLKVRLCSE